MSTDFNETPGASRYRKPVANNQLSGIVKNPFFKLALVVVVIAGAALAANKYSNSRNDDAKTLIPIAATPVQGATTTTEITPEYQQEIQKLDDTRADQAEQNFTGAMPTPMQNAVAAPTIDENAASTEAKDPLKDFENMISTTQQAPQPQAVVAPKPTIPPEVIQNMSSAYRAQMDLLMRQWEPSNMQEVSGYREVSATNNTDKSNAADKNAQTDGPTIVKAGMVYYG